MIGSLRIGILIREAGSWLGGISYIENLVRSIALLSAERPRLFLVTTAATLPFVEKFEAIAPLFEGHLCLLSPEEELSEAAAEFGGLLCPSYEHLFEQIDFLYPCMQSLGAGAASYPHAAWIPDFQHVDLPQFFSDEEIQQRHALFLEISVLSPLLVLSSQHTAQKFQHLYPVSTTTCRVLSFHTLPDEDWYATDPLEVARRYQLPDRFLICMNQFWQHKGHPTLFEAIAQLNQPDLHLVCTGTASDYRNPGYLDQLRQQIHELGLANQVHILGSIPREDQIQLLRQSLAVVQPSLYEGWSTVVEEARALGKPLLLSDFPVHLEQNPDRAVFFNQGDAQDLARAIAQTLPTLSPGPDAAEATARSQAIQRAQAFAQQFCQIALEASFIFSRKPQAMPPELWTLLSEPLTPEILAGETADSPQEAAPNSTDMELRSQLRQAQLDLVQAQTQSRQVPILRRQLDSTRREVDTFKTAAAERLALIDQLQQAAEERLALIQQLDQAAGERLQVIQRQQQQIERLQTQQNALQQQALKEQKQAALIQQQVGELRQAIAKLQQQNRELEQRAVALGTSKGALQTLWRAVRRRIGWR